MENATPVIDPFLFDRQFQRFRKHVIDESGRDFVSFSSNPYTEQQEGYKYDIYRNGRITLGFKKWQESDIGGGKIARAVIAAIELKGSNLVQWQPRYGNEARPHHGLYVAIAESSRLKEYEEILYRLYFRQSDEEVFDELVRLFGRKYPLIAYLFFLSDRSRYMPIAPNYFDKAFESLGVDFVVSHRCSWENYLTFNDLLAEIKVLLAKYLDSDVSLLDAHSFAWMLSTKLSDIEVPDDIRQYQSLSNKEREAIVKARIGQGRFRSLLIQYWSACAVTGCKEHSLLVASHIKPWSKCDLKEAIDPYNGLLLSPSLNMAFDAGYVSFANTGEILVSERLSSSDAEALAIDESLCLSRVAPEHQPYLEYHRKYIFRKS